MISNLFNIDKEIIAITGASGQLGIYYTEKLLMLGAKVVSLDIKEHEIFDSLEKEYPDNFLYVKTNILDKSSINKSLTTIKNKFKDSPTVLINNAAKDSPPESSSKDNCSFEEYSEEQWDNVIDTDIKGSFMCCQVFGNEMAKNKNGSIINISSIYGIVSPDQSLYEYKRRNGDDFYKPVAYSVSKSGMLNLTRYLSVYWASKNIRVNTLTLGGVYNNQDKEFLNNYTNRVPMKRMANPDDYIGAIVYLSSDASKYTTGSNLIIDGGWTAI
jgi:NAD(P)-dependent dehydrogenase (short-subunit alcohol dehydrogenase family)